MGGFAKYERSEAALPAWLALSPAAREIYMRLKLLCYAHGKNRNNNGSVFRSPRDMAKDSGLSPKTVSAAYAELQAKGWIVATKIWQKGFNGKGRTTNWRLTMLPSGANAPHDPPTREPTRWTEGNDYPVVVYQSYMPKPRKGRIKNITLSPNRTHYRARLGCDAEGKYAQNVVPVHPNRTHGGGR